jgi:2-polyprenyl-3-methyl-5-hydroxy-6-metoxy-1,4-benzoquinol methylase
MSSSISKDISERIRNVNIYDQQRPYQSINNINGIRNTKTRLQLMQFPENFNQESILDIGCNTGVFCLEAKKRNAGRIMGIDYSTRSILLAKDLNTQYGYDIEFNACNLNHDFSDVTTILGVKSFDNIFALSVWKHIYDNNFWAVIRLYCRKHCYIELNAVQDGRYHSTELKQLIKKLKHSPNKMCQYLLKRSGAKTVIYLGQSKDNGKRGCYKINFQHS